MGEIRESVSVERLFNTFSIKRENRRPSLIG